MNCPGSIGLAKSLGVTHTKSGFAAKEGTAAHEVLARCLEGNMTHEPWEFIGTKVTVEGDDFVVDQKMADALNLCFNHICENVQLANAYGEVLKFIETSMKHSEHDLMYGTTDCGIVAIKHGKARIWINDLKYGAGITVEPTSAQIKYYACLIVDRLIQDKIIRGYEDVINVTLTIMQPRIPHPDGLIRSIDMAGQELGAWYRDELVPAMDATEDPDAILRMGDWCTFCPAKDRCPAMASAIVNLATCKPPEEMSGEELGETLQKIEAIVKMKEKFEKVAFERAIRGERIGGKKLVRKKANRQWRTIAEQALVDKYGEDAFEKKLKTPPNIEALPDGKNFVAQYAFTPDAGLTLAPLSDKRQEAKSLMSLLEEGDRDMSDLSA
jgi:hypothetical protein